MRGKHEVSRQDFNLRHKQKTLVLKNGLMLFMTLESINFGKQLIAVTPHLHKGHHPDQSFFWQLDIDQWSTG